MDPELDAYFQVDKDAEQTSSSLRLRGGEAIADDESDVDEEFDSHQALSDTPDEGQLVLRGGALNGMLVSNVFRDLHRAAKTGQQPSRWSATDTFSTSLHTPLGGETTEVRDKWLPLYGYQGVVWFRADMVNTFVDAVDRLLCLDNRAGVSYNLYIMNKYKSYKTKAERDEFWRNAKDNGLSVWCSGVGDYSHERLVLNWIVERLGRLEDDDDERTAFRKVLFVAGPDDPVPFTWEPNPSHRVLKLALEWADQSLLDRPDVAYLRMPENPRNAIYSNQYAPWMAHVCRVLTAGRIENRPGYTPVADAWITIRGRSRGANVIGTYGGMCFLPQLWDAVVSEWERDHNAVVTLEARTGHKAGADRWYILLPGLGRQYEGQYILHEEVDNIDVVRDRIMTLVETSMTDGAFTKLDGLELYLPGTGFFLDSEDPPELVISMDSKSANSAFKKVVDRMVHWRQWLETIKGAPPGADPLSMFPQFITLRPVFRHYSIVSAGEKIQPLTWDPNTMNVAEFRNLVTRMWRRSRQGERPIEPDEAFICIKQGTEGSDESESKPALLVTPSTTEKEWQSIRSLIVDPEVSVEMVNERDLPSK